MAQDDFSDILLDTTLSLTTKTNTANTGGGSAVPGTVLRARIHVENWYEPGDSHTLDCGAFEVDACEFDFPPAVFSIKAVSTSVQSSARREEKSRAWEETTLQEVAQDIASDAGMSLIYDVPDEIVLDRVDQLQQNDLEFLQELCTEYGVCLKVTDNQVVLFDEHSYEQKPPVTKYTVKDVRTKNNPEGRLLKIHFSQDTSESVSESSLSYKDKESGKLVEATFEPEEAPATGQRLKLNTRPGNLSGDGYRSKLSGSTRILATSFANSESSSTGIEDTIDDFSDIRSDTTPTAERQAKAKAREKNKNEWTCEATMMLDIRLVGGVTVNIAGFGVYDGKYYIDEAAHKVGGGGETSITAHRVLKGY